MKKISVIIPVYNAEKYIKKCVNSTRTQTLSDIEIICVDDGSTDSSLSILTEMASIDERIILISQDNRGASSARNEGLKKATGEYILFLDSDDWYCDNSAFEELYSIASDEKLDILFFEAKPFFDEDVSEKMKQTFLDKKIYRNVIDYGDAVSGQKIFCEFQRNRNYRAPVTRQMYNRNFLASNELTFAEGIIHEDELFAIQCLTLAKKVKSVNIVAYGRLFRSGSIMTSEDNYLSSCLGYYNAYKQMIMFGEKNIDCFSSEYLTEYCKLLIRIKSSCALKYSLASKELDSLKDRHIDNKDKLLLSQFKQEYDALKKAKAKNKRIKKSLEYRMGSKLLAIPRAIKK